MTSHDAHATCPTADATTFAANKPDRLSDVTPSSPTCPSTDSVCGNSIVMLPGDSDGVANPDNEYLVVPLFVFLPGTDEVPEDYTQVLRMAAFAGYRTIGLSYHNDNEIDDQCNLVEDRQSCESDYRDECAYEVRKERLTGADDADTLQEVAEEDSISYRLLEVLAELDAWDTGSDWHFDSYCTHGSGCAAALAGGSAPWDDEIDWTHVVLAGFSQGAGYPHLWSLRTELDGIVSLEGGNDGCCIDANSNTECDGGETLEVAEYYPALEGTGGGASPGNGEFASLHVEHAYPGMLYPELVPDTFPYVQLHSGVHELDGPSAEALPLTQNVVRTTQNWPATPSTCGFHNSVAVSACIPSEATYDASLPNPVLTSSNTPHLHLFEAYVEGFCNARALPSP